MHHLQWATTADFDALGHVMFDAVRNGPSPYNNEQREAWVPEPRNGVEWHERLSAQDIIMALENSASENQTILGFMSLAETDNTALGYVDFAYILPKARGAGLFKKLYHAIETRAGDKGLRQLQTHASLMAAPAFAACGFKIVLEEEVLINSETLKRSEMEKSLVT